MLSTTEIDDLNEVKKYDPGGLYESIRLLPDQVIQSWTEIHSVKLPVNSLIQNVIVAGMGGSAIGGRIVDSLMESRVRVPIEIVTKPELPKYVGSNTLVIISSYSGNTQETINACRQAISAKAIIVVTATGGKLASIAEDNQLYRYIYDPVNNPCNQPRMGLGYSVASTLGILARLELIHLASDEINGAVEIMKKTLLFNDLNVPANNNSAKSMALKMFQKIPVLIAADHLLGVVYALKNQINENSKSFSCLFDIPELNHHLLEGLTYPVLIKKNMIFVFFESELYSPFIKNYFKVTSDIFFKNGFSITNHTFSADDKIKEIFECLVYSSLVSYYLARLYRQDPLPIPWVNYFKSHLSL